MQSSPRGSNFSTSFKVSPAASNFDKSPSFDACQQNMKSHPIMKRGMRTCLYQEKGSSRSSSIHAADQQTRSAPEKLESHAVLSCAPSTQCSNDRFFLGRAMASRFLVIMHESSTPQFRRCDKISRPLDNAMRLHAAIKGQVRIHIMEYIVEIVEDHDLSSTFRKCHPLALLAAIENDYQKARSKA